jgi:hypothetical protein
MLRLRCSQVEDNVFDCDVIEGSIRKKRKPSAFNLHIKECLSKMKGKPGKHHEKFKLCVNEWKKKKKHA